MAFAFLSKQKNVDVTLLNIRKDSILHLIGRRFSQIDEELLRHLRKARLKFVLSTARAPVFHADPFRSTFILAFLSITSVSAPFHILEVLRSKFFWLRARHFGFWVLGCRQSNISPSHLVFHRMLNADIFSNLFAPLRFRPAERAGLFSAQRSRRLSPACSLR